MRKRSFAFTEGFWFAKKYSSFCNEKRFEQANNDGNKKITALWET